MQTQSFTSRNESIESVSSKEVKPITSPIQITLNNKEYLLIPINAKEAK